jgi:TatD DNase family protein
MVIDTHCHLDMLEDVPDALERMRAAGIARAVTIGVDLASSEWAVEAASRHEEVFATVGLHPHDAKDRTDALMGRLAELAADPRVVGVGEAGLDYHYDNSPRARQREVFAEQIRLANQAGKPLVIHSREAWDDTFAILEAEGVPERLVFHCFSGGPAEAERALSLGAVLSFSGVVSFRNAEDLRAAARMAPLDRIVIETDSPFLTPVPHRGKRNEPAFVIHVAEALAAAKDLPFEEVAQATTATATRLFDLDR